MLGVSQRYERKFTAAAQESGYAAADTRLKQIDEEIMRLSPRAFEAEPTTVAGIAAQAQALLAISGSRPGGLAEYQRDRVYEAGAEAMARGAIRVAGISHAKEPANA